MISQLEKFFNDNKRPLVLISGLEESQSGAVCEFLLKLKAPVYLEATSQLRGLEKLNPLVLKSGASFLNPDRFKKYFDSVLRIGSVPTLRLWRDLEMSLSHVPVLSVSDLPFSGLSHDTHKPLCFADFFRESTQILGEQTNFAEAGGLPQGEGAVASSELLEKESDVFTLDAMMTERLEELFGVYKKSEPTMFRFLAEKLIPQNSFVMLGNSLPIREWDLAAPFINKNLSISANRGANGIDGLVATFLGEARNKNENWLILGDLSALYDLNALAFTRYADSQNLRIVVINNSGGQIFSRMFNDKNFLNTHEFEFTNWAKMFGWEYVRITDAVLTDVNFKKQFELNSESNFSGPTIFEVIPQNSESELFWQNYEDIFK